jgi:membrane associated rhomboid family serine protease
LRRVSGSKAAKGEPAMFPIGDDNTARRSLPVVTYALIALNVLFFFVELSGGEPFIQRWAFIPLRFGLDPAGTIPTIFTAMFMHAGWLHLGGNMLYLWIFGDNVEDRFGSVKFLIFYLVCGIAATLAQYYVSPGSRIPNVGASGAIAGVLGSYLLLFPQARVRVLLYNQIVAMPAIFVLGFWIVLQIFAGAGALFATAQSEDVGGVAYMAHVGGFVAGFLFTYLLAGRGPGQGSGLRD